MENHFFVKDVVLHVAPSWQAMIAGLVRGAGAHILEQQLVGDEGLALLEGGQRVAAAPARVGVHVQPITLPHHCGTLCT